MTLPLLEVSFHGMFEFGQAYVSLSRATDLEGLKLCNFDPRGIKAHPKVVAFYKDELGYTEEVLLTNDAMHSVCIRTLLSDRDAADKVMHSG